MRQSLRIALSVTLILAALQLLSHWEAVGLIEEPQQSWMWYVNRVRVPERLGLVVVNLPSIAESRKAEFGLVSDALARVLAGNPKAIAIDAGSGPQLGQPLQDFERSLLNRGWNRKVCYGVTILRNGKSDQWLGDKQFAPQAATLLAPQPKLGVRRIVYELRFSEDKTVLPGLAKCLADFAGIPPIQISAVLSPFVEFASPQAFEGFTAYTFPINFAALGQIRRDALDLRELMDTSSRTVDLANQVVLLGYKDKLDVLSIPGETRPLFGVEVQAAAFYTLLHHPLYTLTLLGGLIVDVLLAIIFVVLVNVWYAKAKGKEGDESNVKEFGVIVGLGIRLAAATFLASLAFSIIGLFMPDVVLIATGALLHPYADRLVAFATSRLAPTIFVAAVSLTWYSATVSAASPQDILSPEAKIVRVAGIVSVDSSGTRKFFQAKDAAVELRAGDRVDCRSGSAVIQIYGLRAEGKVQEVSCTQSTFEMPEKPSLVTPILSTLESNFQVLGRR